MHCMTLISGSSGEGDGGSHGSRVQPQNQGHRNHGAPRQGQNNILFPWMIAQVIRIYLV